MRSARRVRRLAGLTVLVAASLIAVSCRVAPPPGTSSTPSGRLDAVSGVEGGVVISGWASDWDTLAPIKVVVMINGQWVKGVFDANKARPDVGAAFGRGDNFGFHETIPAPAGKATVCVVALNVGAGEDSLLEPCRDAQVAAPSDTTGNTVPPASTTTTTTVAPEPAWRTVVNNGDTPPGAATAFNSYNQPSVNASGLVTFRARTKGEGARGVYARAATSAGSPLQTIGAVGGLVPAPNNLDGDFNEFPSIPRIDDTGSMIATRGQSVPVWTYTPDGGVETRVGTSGIYATVNGTLTTGASLLGAVPGFEQFAVPGVTPTGRFDQFPGAPAVDGTTIVFKGNYTDGDAGETGVFFRDVADADGPTQRIASSDTLIPNQPDVDGQPGTVRFGSTAPPSAANGRVVFTALDNEGAPTLGGVYLAPIETDPELEPLVAIGDQVPGMEATDVFTTIGEGLSFDGRFVTFWGTWGDTEQITLECPEDGNKDLLAYCNETYPDGYVADVAIHQGIFIHDTVTSTTTAVATSDSADPEAQFDTFQYWTFSGKPPTDGGGGDEGGDESQELPRWRSSAFAAVSGSGADYKVAFKATAPSGTTGIHLAQGPTEPAITTVVDTTTMGSVVDPEAPADTFVTTVGIERDGFRGRYLAINVGMANADASVSWGGVYLVTVDRLPAAAAAAADQRAAAAQPELPGLHSRQDAGS